ncbi:hypothetical protein HD806DRAFT_533247 [Xylariaceae sp. AK1471]|nr:hypothetical protein HD806DRAFT_533247 [Xylariaceae sp. AK1471]
MRAAALALLTAAFVKAAPTSTSQEAVIVIEASHHGAGSDLTNTTITVPIDGTVYTNTEALAEVSSLYLLSPESVICTPYKNEDGTGTGGLPFTVGNPSRLSTNTVVVGSIVCTSTLPPAVIVIEASHGGAGSGLTYTTITVPIGPVYTNEEALAEVSSLYLVKPESATCTPYKNGDGTGTGGLPFTVGKPSLLSTNTVVVGSIADEQQEQTITNVTADHAVAPSAHTSDEKSQDQAQVHSQVTKPVADFHPEVDEDPLAMAYRYFYTNIGHGKSLAAEAKGTKAEEKKPKEPERDEKVDEGNGQK